MSVEIISADVFESLPITSPPPKTDPFWDSIIEALGDGKIVKIPFANDKEKRGRRQAAGRRAKVAGFAIEIRYGETFMAIRRANETGADSVAPAVPVPSERRRKAVDV